MTDFDDVEVSKENIQPLRQGRRIDILKKVCDAPLKVKHELSVQRRQFEEEVEAAAPEGKLEAWSRYLAWTRQHHPSGGRQAHLVPLYERATQQFLRCGLQDDDRCVRHWLDFATLVSDPLVVYQFMDHSQVGHRDARFYVAWAVHLEALRRYAEAEAVYHSGRQRNAQPSTLLREHYEQFALSNVQRMREQFAALDCGLPSPPPAWGDENGAGRTPLHPLRATPAGTVSSHRTAATTVQPPQPFQPFACQSDATSRLKRPALHIYEDVPPRPAEPAFSWPPLAPECIRRKENVPPTLKWVNTTLPSAAPAPHCKVRKLDIWVDPDSPSSAAPPPASSPLSPPAAQQAPPA
eukprot:EG_transcript_15337